MKNLDDIRVEINAVDDQLLDLIVKRLNLSKEVAEYKKANDMQILDRSRELAILDRITEDKSPDLVVPLRETYESLFRVSRRRQSQLIEPDNTFINGVTSTFTDAPFPTEGSVAISSDQYDAPIAKALFDNPHLLTLNNDMKIVDAVNSGLCQYGILPIEDNRSGAKAITYDLLIKNTCHIVRGMKVSLHYKLVAANNVPFTSLKKIVVDRRSYYHCSDFLAGLKVDIIEKSAADILKQIQDPSDDFIAWIVPDHTPVGDNLHVLRQDVVNPGDYIRYICLAKNPQIHPDANCISLMLSVPNVAGGLDDVLSPLAALGVNLSLLESRPIVDGDHTTHRFFMDMDSDIHQPQVQLVINDLSRDCPTFVLLGAYKDVEMSL
ncbi:MAG: chorismate mutase [Peptococcaceae bacterium]|nr:chorismate mutase [Peptococcaceae bacterium]